MDLSLFICKQKLMYVYLLNHFLCGDVISIIDTYIHPFSMNLLHKKEIIDEIHKERNKGNYQYEIMWNVKPSYSMMYQNKQKIPFIKDSHDLFCGCYQCLCRFDYPRYVYLMKRCRKPMRGSQATIINHWILFLSYLSGNKGISGSKIYDLIHNEVNDQKHFGFVSKYDLQYNMIKKKKRETLMIKNMRLKSDKNKWIQLLHIWENIQLL
jgi:hypothetical protein